MFTKGGAQGGICKNCAEIMGEQRINIGNSEKEKIVTKELKINKNVFIYNESVIPLCNISRLSVTNEAKEAYQTWTFVTVFIGILCLFTGNVIGVLIGLALIALGGLTIYKTYSNNQKLGEYLILNLNSGRDIYLYSNNHNFTIEIMDVIINCMNSGKEYRINMENCQIEACQFGEHNVLSGGRTWNGN